MAGRSALVIAADDEFRKQISQAFVRWGFSVSTCTGGHEGLRLARERRPDVVVVDELTADITGRNAASNLQQDPETGDIPVIVLDGESVAGAEGVDISALTALSLGKPFSARGLYARVRAACLGEDYDETGEASPVGGNVRMTHVDAVIVDSDSDMLDWIQMGLQKRGITVYCASSAGDGLDFLLGNTAGVVFVDIDSPGLDVRDTVASFLGAAGSKDAPIYIITGLPGDRAETFGCAGVLYKPFGIQEIADVIMEGTSFPDVRIVD